MLCRIDPTYAFGTLFFRRAMCGLIAALRAAPGTAILQRRNIVSPPCNIDAM
jgi:hypothetical protein